MGVEIVYVLAFLGEKHVKNFEGNLRKRAGQSLDSSDNPVKVLSMCFLVYWLCPAPRCVATAK